MTAQVNMDLFEIEIKNKLQKMSVGMFNNSSYWGKSSSVLKSGICKYFRRAIYDKFEWCVMEMMIFGIRSEALLTNIINRIKILIMEEIVNDFEKISMCIVLLNRMENKLFLEKVEDMKRICDIVKTCKRGRVVSYLHNWYKFNNIVYDNDIVCNKILKYKKKGDSDRLLKLGERLIEFVENCDEKIYDIYIKMYNWEGVEGSRYRRTDGIYLFIEIMENYFAKDENKKRIFKFVLDRFNKKTMKERKLFGIWLGIMCIKDREKIVDLHIEDGYDNNKMINYLFKERNNIEIKEDFVINDWHVNKKWGLAKFGNVGSLVINEDLSILSENGLKYKNFYILKK